MWACLSVLLFSLTADVGWFDALLRLVILRMVDLAWCGLFWCCLLAFGLVFVCLLGVVVFGVGWLLIMLFLFVTFAFLVLFSGFMLLLVAVGGWLVSSDDWLGVLVLVG